MKMMDGSGELGMCLTLHVLAKSFNFFGRPRVKVLLHLWFMVDGCPLYQPCLKKVSTFKA